MSGQGLTRRPNLCEVGHFEKGDFGFRGKHTFTEWTSETSALLCEAAEPRALS